MFCMKASCITSHQLSKKGMGYDDRFVIPGEERCSSLADDPGRWHAIFPTFVGFKYLSCFLLLPVNPAPKSNTLYSACASMTNCVYAAIQ